MKRQSKRPERTQTIHFRISVEEREILDMYKLKTGCRSMMDLIFYLINENEKLKEDLVKKEYKLQQEEIITIDKRLKRQDNELRIIKTCVETMIGAKEFKKVIGKVFRGYND